jgi:prepilin-type N-terminal cleavage/methylation domain-containing protein
MSFQIWEPSGKKMSRAGPDWSEIRPWAKEVLRRPEAARLLRQCCPMRRSQSGYTLLELIVTMGIMMILAASAVQAFATYRKKAYEAVAIQYMRSWPPAQELYLVDKGSYADADETLAQGAYKINKVPTTVPYDFSIDSGASQKSTWWGRATPTTSGLRHFCVSRLGVVRSGSTPQNCQSD